MPFSYYMQQSYFFRTYQVTAHVSWPRRRKVRGFWTLFPAANGTCSCMCIGVKAAANGGQGGGGGQEGGAQGKTDPERLKPKFIYF